LLFNHLKMNRKKIVNNKSKTSASLITKVSTRIFLIFTLLNVLVISAVVAFSSLQIRESEGASILSSVHEAAQNGNINWKEFELGEEDGERSDFIRVTRPSGTVDESHGTTQFLKSRSLRWGYFSLSDDDVFWYSSVTSHGIKTELWLDITIVLNMVLRTIVAIVITMLVVYFGAMIALKRSAKRISQPIEALAKATDMEKSELIVPDFPVEVERLAKSFNQLLGRLNQKIEQEQQFVSDASHELRTPVAAIRGHVTLLKRRWREHPEIVEDSLNYIDEESLRMKRMIEELLTISRGNHFSMENEIFDLSEFTDRTVKEIQPALTQKIIFENDLSFSVSADRAAIQKILVAFLENAGKYSPADSKIIVRLREQGDSIDLSVADEGIGIADEEKEKIFERFYRVDKSRSSEIPGTGLGLAIAKQYAEACGAWIFVSDNLPQGSVFHLVFGPK